MKRLVQGGIEMLFKVRLCSEFAVAFLAVVVLAYMCFERVRVRKELDARETNEVLGYTVFEELREVVEKIEA